MFEMTTKASLSTQQKRLLELMQEVNFGRIKKLAVHKGEPVFNPSPHVIRDIKIGGENSPRRELEANDFVLKKEVIEFFAQINQLGNGTVEQIKIKHGLPFQMSIEEKVRA